MKITGTKYETIKAAVKAVVEYAGGPAKVKAAYTDLTKKRLVWDLWSAASANILYDDNHPQFALGMCTRVYPYQPGFDVWSGDTTDAHLETALNKIWRELDGMTAQQRYDADTPCNTIGAYEAKFEKCWCAAGPGNNSGLVSEGMLRFDDTADSLAGPFEGGYAYYRLNDNNNLPGSHNALRPEAVYIQQNRFSHWNLAPYDTPALSEAHLQGRLDFLTPKQLALWERRITNFRLETPTLENPFSLQLSGNDDCSYTKYYPTLEAAQAELASFLSVQSLNFPLHVQENGFVFTN